MEDDAGGHEQDGAPGANGDGSSIPPPFDSLANLRALGDIQRRGLEAANQVVGRLIDRVDRSGPLFGAEPAPDPSGTAAGAGPYNPLSQEAMAQYAEMMSSFMATVVGAAGSGGFGGTPSSAPTASAPADGAVVVDPLVMAPAAPGAAARGELWLHNRSGAAVRDVRLHLGDLRRHDGWAIEAAAVTFEPAAIEELPDLTSRGVRVSVDVPADAPPGVYRGTVMASNLPDVWLVLELAVVAA